MVVRVLLVDDDSVHLELSERFLTRQSSEYKVVAVETSEEAIKLLKDENFDAAVCDIDLASDSMSGLDILEQIRSSGKDVPVIIFTGKSREEFAIQALNLGADYYIRKSSINIDSLYAELSYYILTAVEKRKTKKALQDSELKLRISEGRLADAQRIAHSGSWVWEIEENIISWSDEIYRIFGLAPQEFSATYEAFLESVHPDDRELVDSAVNAAFHKQVQYSIDHRIIQPNGTIRFVHEEAEVTYNDKGNPIQMVGTVHDITERMETEAQIREERDKNQRYLDLAGTMILALDTSFSVTMINQKGCDMLGYDENDVVGKNWVKSFIAEPLQEHANSYLKKVLSSEHKEESYCNFKIITKSGKQKAIHCHGTSIFDDDSNAKTILCSAQHVDEIFFEEVQDEKLVSQSIITNEEMFREIFEKSPICIELFDSDGILTRANKQSVQLFGVEGVEDLIGFNLFNDPNIPNPVKDELRKGNAISLETRFDFSKVKLQNQYKSSKTGIMHLQAMFSPLHYGIEEGFQGYIIHIQDVTDRHVTEQALMESRESFKELYNNALIGLFRVRISDGMILECNDQFATIFNFENRQILIDSACFFKDFLPSSDAWTQLKGSMKEHERLVTELSVTTKDRQRLWLRFSLRMWPEKGYIEGVMSDITQEKQALEMLSKQKEELSDFAHTMSHDLKNIFQNMVGYIELMEDENNLTHLERLHALVFETSQLIDHSVVLADAGLIVEEQLVEVDLDKLVKLVAESTIPELIEYVQDPLPIAKADEMKVTQIFRNLFDNAVNHGNPTKIEVKCEVRQGKFCITIRNNGTEIPEQIRSKIFTKGFTTSKSGQGFGLTIVKRIVEAHNWTIHLTSSRMTTFELIIPEQDTSI